MSRDWLNGPDKPAMAEWELEADDLYAGVMVVDFTSATARLALSGDFVHFVPVESLDELQRLSALEEGC